MLMQKRPENHANILTQLESEFKETKKPQKQKKKGNHEILPPHLLFSSVFHWQTLHTGSLESQELCNGCGDP